MGYFIRYDPATGAITSSGCMPDAAIAAEMAEGKPIRPIAERLREVEHAALDPVGGEIVHHPPPPPAPPTYAALRLRAYPPLTELADALYWQANGDPTKFEAWLEAVAAVKEQIPKPATPAAS